MLKSPGRDEQVTHLNLQVKPVTKTIIVGATPASPKIPKPVLHSGADVSTCCPRIVSSRDLRLPRTSRNVSFVEAGNACKCVAPTSGSNGAAQPRERREIELHLLGVDLLESEGHSAGGGSRSP